MKKYRINSSELFNLQSMYDHLKCMEIDLREGLRDDWDYVMGRIEEVEKLLSKVNGVGSLVDWPTLKRIREIKDERNFIRYNIAIQNGANEIEAGNAFM